MIKARELRIGNKIKQAFYTLTVIAISRNHVWCMDDNNRTGKCNFENVNGIALTPDILASAGFVRNGNYWDKGYFSLTVYPTKDGREIILIPNHNIAAIELKYLHQLQNLYFTLTFKELEIKINSPATV